MPTDIPDLYIINTCTVTHRADSNCRNLIRRAVRTNPDARIVVVGCYVDAEPELIEGMEGVDLIIGNEHKENIGRLLAAKYPDLLSEESRDGCPAVANRTVPGA